MDNPALPPDRRRARGYVWRFARCEFDESRRELRVHGEVVDIEAKPLELLYQLLLRDRELVTRDELLKMVWPGVSVVEGSLSTAISKLRKALGDEAHIVKTIPRVGYRLDAAAERTATVLTLHPGDSVPGRSQWRLVRKLSVSCSGQTWVAKHPGTSELRVFRMATGDSGLADLRREMGDRLGFGRILEWNFETSPYYVESEYRAPRRASRLAVAAAILLAVVAVAVRLTRGTSLKLAATPFASSVHRP